MLEIDCKLVPVKMKTIEKFVLYVYGYPETMMHIDNFYQAGNYEIYDRLEAGQTVHCTMRLYVQEDQWSG